MRCTIPANPHSISYELEFPSNYALSMLVGEFGAHIKMLEEAYGVEIHQRGLSVSVDPSFAKAERALATIGQIYQLIESGHPIGPQDVRHCIGIMAADPTAKLIDYFSDTVLVGSKNRRITPRTVGQREYLNALRQHDVVFGVGPAGTGKTYLAVSIAAAALVKGEVKRLILTRPAVEAGEKLGFLPGDLNEKINPYLRPLYDALYDMFTLEKTERMIERGQIEVVPLAFMRGRTLEDAYVILDEAQNTSIEQMKMFLTRMGLRSRLAITGDETQVDLPRGMSSGLVHALRVLKHVDRIRVCRFGIGDIVRHPIVADVVEAYESSGHGRTQ